MLNEKIASILYEIADLLELKDEKFKPQAYRKAARNIETLPEDVVDVYKRGKLGEIPGVGEAIEAKVTEIIKTGELQYLKDLRNELPAGLMQLLDIPEIGPKTTMRLYKELKVTNLQDLKTAAEQGRIRRMKGFGERTEENILKGITLLERSQGRMLLGYALPIAEGMVAYLKEKGVLKLVSVAGSLRRMRETIGDIDILVGTEDAEAATEVFVSYPEVLEVIVRGQTKTSVRLSNGTQVDLRVVSEDSYGAALQYFTGSKEHNVVLRSLAIDMGMKLNEYGLFRKDDESVVARRAEEDIYRALGMRIMPPEIRENRGEIQAAKKGELPTLVELQDIQGDLHVHTNASDGAASMEEMVRAAQLMGYRYIGISDHSQSLKVGNGLSIERLRDNIALARALSSETLRVFIGAEVEIDERGHLDYPSEVLEEVDYVIGAVHSRFKMTETEMTNRLLTALTNDQLDILAHPTGRLIAGREPYPFDMDLIMKAARDNRVCLEVNSYPERLDLNDLNCRKAREEGNMLSINTDSHSIAHLGYMRYGVAVARRGWVGPELVLNCLSPQDLDKRLKG